MAAIATFMPIPFNTLAYAKKLKNAGVTEDVAEVHAEALAEIVSEQLATKKDLKDLELTQKNELKELELSLSYKLTLRLGAMIAAGIAIIAILIKI